MPRVSYLRIGVCYSYTPYRGRQTVRYSTHSLTSLANRRLQNTTTVLSVVSKLKALPNYCTDVRLVSPCDSDTCRPIMVNQVLYSHLLYYRTTSKYSYYTDWCLVWPCAATRVKQRRHDDKHQCMLSDRLRTEAHTSDDVATMTERLLVVELAVLVQLLRRGVKRGYCKGLFPTASCPLSAMTNYKDQYLISGTLEKI